MTAGTYVPCISCIDRLVDRASADSEADASILLPPRYVITICEHVQALLRSPWRLRKRTIIGSPSPKQSSPLIRPLTVRTNYLEASPETILQPAFHKFTYSGYEFYFVICSISIQLSPLIIQEISSHRLILFNLHSGFQDSTGYGHILWLRLFGHFYRLRINFLAGSPRTLLKSPTACTRNT